MAGLSEADQAANDEAHARKHYGQSYGQSPALPYHDTCSDVLHMYLNVVKKALEVVFHKPFQIKERGYTGRLKELMEGMRKEMNVRMAKDFVDRRFGGEGAFSLLGDQVKAFLRGGYNNKLIPDLLAIIQPYFDLLNSDGEMVREGAAAPAAAPAGMAEGRGAGGVAQGRGRGSSGRGKGRPPKQAAGGRPFQAGRGRGRGSESGEAGRGRGQGVRQRTIRDVEHVSSSDDEEAAEPTRNSGTDDDEPRVPEAPSEPPSFRVKVVTMFLALSAHYQFVHDVNTKRSRDILRPERERNAREAYMLGCCVVRAVVAVAGGEARQTYLHDMVYGLQKLYLVLGKPYLGATEGNEHAHQEMKKDFRMMCSHSNKRLGDMLQLMNCSHLRRHVIATGGQFAPRTRETESNLHMTLGLKDGKRKRKRHDDAIPIADAHLEALKTATAAGETGAEGGGAARGCC